MGLRRAAAADAGVASSADFRADLGRGAPASLVRLLGAAFLLFAPLAALGPF